MFMGLVAALVAGAGMIGFWVLTTLWKLALVVPWAVYVALAAQTVIIAFGAITVLLWALRQHDNENRRPITRTRR
jgi:hypothetical protein